ncbi:MAG: bifunctional UDP-N-acetylglucosamine diphosphorylase/glucosamine-1-phosphate N-acetyltransferase GlmU [Dehalococcoidia bacterium]
MADLAVIVLAAGQGTRMKSAVPKVLHPVGGVPMASLVLEAARATGPKRIIVVVGHGGDAVRSALAAPDVTFVSQDEQLGTGHAVRLCREAAEGCSEVLVLNGDCPLIEAPLLARLWVARGEAALAFVTAWVEDAGRLGRVQRDKKGRVTKVVEAADYRGKQRGAEINAGQYLFDGSWLWPALDRVPVSPSGEIYLTHLIELAVAEKRDVHTSEATAVEVTGVDDRLKLAEAEAALRSRVRLRLIEAGVTIVDPATTYIDASVTVDPDVTILPGCHIGGKSSLARGAVVGPNVVLRNAVIGPDCRVDQSTIEDSQLAARVHVGPYAHIRGNSTIGEDCHLGNFAEVNRSTLGRGVKMHHFSYLGDATVGDRANIAAGVITNNYDGKLKHPTTIGDDAFVGCDTMLVAPVTMGPGSQTGAGTVLKMDLPAGALAVGVPARIIRRREE